MPETLQEFVTSHGATLRVDREAGVIRGVKILGLSSKNGRSYEEKALQKAVPLYEGVKVNVNHARGGVFAPRDYEERLGVIRNAAFQEGRGLYGDLHFNPKHALAEQLAWDAEHAPQNVGLSHNVEARLKPSGSGAAVEEILKVLSVDLVADPATTSGLFESHNDVQSLVETGDVTSLTAEQIRNQYSAEVASLLIPMVKEHRRLSAELEQLRSERRLGERRDMVYRCLREFGLPCPDESPWAREIVSESFVKMLMAAADETELRQLVEERSRLVKKAAMYTGPVAERPALCRAREQRMTSDGASGTRSASEFVAAISS